MNLEAARCHFAVRVTGYQFPDSPSRLWRYSWHTVEGDADDGRHAWRFTYPALTCAESPRVASWLRAAGAWLDEPDGDPPPPLRFTEPTFAFRLMPKTRQLRVTVSQEFSPLLPPQSYGDYDMDLAVTSDALRAAADDWEDECRPFPDVSATYGPELKDELDEELRMEMARLNAGRLRRDAEIVGDDGPA